jgi:hypothetical protein
MGRWNADDAMTFDVEADAQAAYWGLVEQGWDPRELRIVEVGEATSNRWTSEQT